MAHANGACYEVARGSKVGNQRDRGRSKSVDSRNRKL